MISNFSTPPAEEARAISSSSPSTMSLVSAEMVTPAQPLVGMVWLMVSIFAPELAKSCGLIEHKAVVGPPNARRLAVTYGFKRWPALVFFRDGKYLGAVDGLRLWADLVREADEIMHSEPHYPPSVGIPVRSI